jgi:plasmid maintenance system killer protein
VQLSENGDKAKSENSLLQLLRLYGHTVRRSLRHESNRLQAVIQDISGELQLNGGGSVDISNMIIKLTANILRLLHNSLQIVEASKQASSLAILPLNLLKMIPPDTKCLSPHSYQSLQTVCFTYDDDTYPP